MDNIRYSINDDQLDASTYLSLVQRVWPGNYQINKTSEALRQTINIAAWDGTLLIGTVRILTDGYYFGTIPEILVDPEYQNRGIGRRLMELAWESAPTSIFLGAQPGNEGFFEKMGFTRGLTSYQKKKPRT